MKPAPPWAQLPGDDDDLDFAYETDTDQAGKVESAMRWRLILGRFADEHLGYDKLGEETSAGEQPSDLSDLLGEATQMDRSLEFIYDREFARRSHRQVGAGSGRGLTIPAWLSGVRQLFPEEAVHVIERDALSRYGMTELVTDAEILRESEPTTDLLKAILQFKHLMKGEVLDAAREVVAAVVEQLAAELRNDSEPALYGTSDPTLRPPQKNFRNTDWHRTIRDNLKRYDTENERLVVDRIRYRHRQRARGEWRVIIAVDQSGSMMDSLIHSCVMAAIFASMPALDVRLVLWDHRIMDVSDLAHDPLEILMGVQLGGGTQLLPAMEYCAGLITEPDKTLFVVLSDWYIWSGGPACLKLAADLTEAGVHGIGLCALDADNTPIYEERFARELAGAGWFVAALTPRKLAEYVAKQIG